MLTLEDGSPFVLHEFQQTMLADYFAGTTETLILVPKKNGKTTLLAALALHHLMVTPDAECVIAAASRDQAQILLNQARGFVKRSGLSEYMTIKQREIVSLKDEGRVRVMASDSDTADGVIPSLAIVDEWHRHKDDGAMYGVFRDGLGPRGGRMLTISTAGNDEGSPLGMTRDVAYTWPNIEVDGAYRCARAPSGDVVMHEWALHPDDDRSDLQLVKTANPAPWQTVEALERRYSSPSMAPWQWARFACGVWVRDEDAWLPIGAWADLVDPKAEIPAGAQVVLGVDIGTKSDTSAVVRLWERPDDKRIVCECEVFAPRKDGTALDIEVVEAAIRDHTKRFKVRAVVYDKWSFERSAQDLGRRGLTMIEQPMSAERMVIASQNLYAAVMSRKLVHNGDPVLAAHVNAGGTKSQGDRGWRLVKGQGKRPIDALIALSLAYTQFTRPPKPKPRFEVLA